jgi:uncharacterized protein (TIGR00369 family)
MTETAYPPADLPGEDDLLSMSGLEFMRAILNGTLPLPPTAVTLGLTLHDIQDGRATFRGAPSIEFTNPMGGVHGGWYGTLLDSAMGCAVMTKVPRGSVYTTLEYKINITRAIPCGMAVDCVGKVDHAGRSTGVASGEIRGVEDGKLYATGSSTCIIMKMR